MTSRRILGVAATVVALLAVASCSSDADGAARSTTTATSLRPAPEPIDSESSAPADAPSGVLVPGGSITLGGDAEVEASSEDGAFEVTRRLGDEWVSMTSTEGTLYGSDGLPLRCGDGMGRDADSKLVAATKTSGPSAHLVVLGDDGELVTITTVSPAMAATDRPERLAGLPAAELEQTAFVPIETADALADQPAEEPLEIHEWEHAFDVGLDVEASLGGSLTRGLSYRFEFAGEGEQGLSTDLGGLPCNDRSIAIRPTPDATYQLVLLAGGTTLEVDGEPQTDTVPDAALQGEWAVAKVTKDAGEASVEVLDPAGKRLSRWTLAYSQPFS